MQVKIGRRSKDGRVTPIGGFFQHPANAHKLYFAWEEPSYIKGAEKAVDENLTQVRVVSLRGRAI